MQNFHLANSQSKPDKITMKINHSVVNPLRFALPKRKRTPEKFQVRI